MSAAAITCRTTSSSNSMDVLNLVAALHERFGIDVPESDYERIATPDAAASYLAERLG